MTAQKQPRVRREGKVFAEKCLLGQKCQVSLPHFCRTHRTRRSYLDFLRKLSVCLNIHQKRKCTSHMVNQWCPKRQASQCNHLITQADTRMCLHIADAVRKGAMTVMISTVDPDVVIILVGLFTEIVKLRPDVELWVAFGTGMSYRRLLINDICE